MYALTCRQPQSHHPEQNTSNHNRACILQEKSNRMPLLNKGIHLNALSVKTICGQGQKEGKLQENEPVVTETDQF